MFANRYSNFWTLTMCHNIISVSASYYSSPSAGTFWIDLCKQISNTSPIKTDTEHKPYPISRPNETFTLPMFSLSVSVPIYVSVKYLITSWRKLFLIFSYSQQASEILSISNMFTTLFYYYFFTTLIEYSCSAAPNTRSP